MSADLAGAMSGEHLDTADTLPDHIVCQGGPLDGQWFAREEWAKRIRSHRRMRALDQIRSSGALDYIITRKTIGHPDPKHQNLVGTIAVPLTY